MNFKTSFKKLKFCRFTACFTLVIEMPIIKIKVMILDDSVQLSILQLYECQGSAWQKWRFDGQAIVNQDTGTVCPRSADSFYIFKLPYKLGQDFLNIHVILISRSKEEKYRNKRKR